ncbi:MAG: hypothetical protein NDI61_00760 [Bdellovibrionaceae bacterium]|nr:hypothetical protein [Pseudobdellovibrionaceae bacterium]
MRLKTFSVLLAVIFLVACADSRNRVGSNPAISSPPADLGGAQGGGNGQQTSDAAMGTGDSGGGNGIKGAMFESYVRDVTMLPEWKEHLEPIHQKFLSLAKDPKYPNRIMRVLARAKKWYFVPMELGKIPKDRIGLEITSDPIQQFALQTRKEIWINSELYENMSNQRKAMLLLHEMIMSLYLIRFEDFTTLCREFTDIENPYHDPAQCESGYVKDYFSHMPAEPRRSLSPDDYQSIRSMTAWLFKEYVGMNQEADFYAQLRKHNFDGRLTDFEEKPAMTMDRKRIELTLKGFARLGYLPKYCAYDKNFNATQICELEFDFAPTRGDNDPARFALHLTRKSLDGQILSTHTSNYHLPSFQSNSAYVSTFRGAPATWTLRLNEVIDADSLVIGQTFFDLEIILSGEADSLELFAIQLIPTMVFDIAPVCQPDTGAKNAISVSFGRPNNNPRNELFIFSAERLPAPLLPTPTGLPDVWTSTHFLKTEHSPAACPNFAFPQPEPAPSVSGPAP